MNRNDRPGGEESSRDQQTGQGTEPEPKPQPSPEGEAGRSPEAPQNPQNVHVLSVMPSGLV